MVYIPSFRCRRNWRIQRQPSTSLVKPISYAPGLLLRTHAINETTDISCTRRYLSVRLLLFRILLIQIHQQKAEIAPSTGLYADDDQIMPHVVFQCQVNCTKAAVDMIEFILRNSPGQKQAYILPSNWYTVSCTLHLPLRKHILPAN